MQIKSLRKRGGNSHNNAPNSVFLALPLQIKKPRLNWAVVHSYNPSTLEARQEDYKFKASLGYTVRLCVKERDGRGELGREGRGREREREKGES